MAADRRPTGTVGSEDTALRERLNLRLGLTPMEGRVAESLRDGLTYAEIAERFGISYHTVHTHIKAIHRKASVRSNARLVALMARLQKERP